MEPNAQRADLINRIQALMALEAEHKRDDSALESLINDLQKYQRQQIAAYDRFLTQVGAKHALPTETFRHTAVTAFKIGPGFEQHPDSKVFRSSGTTVGTRSAHYFRDLSLYDRAATISANRHVFSHFAEKKRPRLISLIPSEKSNPESSLSYMVSRFSQWFSCDVTWLFENDVLDVPKLIAVVGSLRSTPVLLFGTSFAFLFAEDALSNEVALPSGSIILQTGGFKGKTRSIRADEMQNLLLNRYRVSPDDLYFEYSMTELSSQLYAGADGRFRWPAWVRVSIIDPQTLEILPEGQEGLIRIDDTANIDSVAALQTADLGILHDDGLELRGRASDAVLRGCSLYAEETLAKN